MHANLISPSALGFVRVAVITPELRVADPTFNTSIINAALKEAAGQGARLALFPELCITGYSCGDLFYQGLLLAAAQTSLEMIAETSAIYDIAAVVGLPLEVGGKLFNCAAFIAGGRVLGLVPKTYLPTTNEFYEERWFTPGDLTPRDRVQINGEEIPIGNDLLFAARDFPDLIIGVEICEDLWAVNPPSGDMALAGATLFLNGSASNELLGKVEYRRDLVRQQSARCLAAYLYAGAGSGESTTDLVWAGHSLIAENGVILAETERFHFDTQMIVCDVDIQRMVHERIRNNAFAARPAGRDYRIIEFSLPGEAFPMQQIELLRPALSRTPFVPADRDASRPTLPGDIQHPGYRARETSAPHRRAKSHHRAFRRA